MKTVNEQDGRLDLLANYLSKNLISPSMLIHSSDMEKVNDFFSKLPRVLILARKDDLGIITFLLRDIAPKYDNIEFISIEDCLEGTIPIIKVVMIPIKPTSDILEVLSKVVQFSALSSGKVILIGSASAVLDLQNVCVTGKWSLMRSIGNMRRFSVTAELDAEPEKQEGNNVYTWGDLDDIDDLEG